MKTARPIARGSARLGFRASPPACAIASKPTKLAKSRAEAARKPAGSSGGGVAAGTSTPSLASSAAAKSPWSNENPATMTIAPRANMTTMSGTTVRS